MPKKIEENRYVLTDADIDLISAALSKETIDEQNAQLERVNLGPFWYRDRQFESSFQIGTMTEREKQEFILASLQNRNKE